jgi:hypothetical protein
VRGGLLVQPSLPANENFGSNSLIGLSSLSCPSAGNCTAVGGYFDSDRNEDGLILSERNGKWLRGLEAPLPANAGPNPQHGDGPEMPLTSVSYPAAGACAALGFYRDKGDNMHTLLLGETAEKWTAGEPKFPADAAGGVDPGGLGSVACTSPGNRVAAGGYVTGTNPDGTYKGKPLLVYDRRVRGSKAALSSFRPTRPRPAERASRPSPALRQGRASRSGATPTRPATNRACSSRFLGREVREQHEGCHRLRGKHEGRHAEPEPVDPQQ